MLFRLIYIIVFLALIFTEWGEVASPRGHVSGIFRVLFYIYVIVIIERMSGKIQRLEDRVMKSDPQPSQNWKDGWKGFSHSKEKE